MLLEKSTADSLFPRQANKKRVGVCVHNRKKCCIFILVSHTTRRRNMNGKKTKTRKLVGKNEKKKTFGYNFDLTIR